MKDPIQAALDKLGPEKVREVLDGLGPSPDRQEECRRDIARVFIWVESRTGAVKADKGFGSKKGWADLQRYKKALEQLQKAASRLDPAIRPWFSPFGAYKVGEPTWIDRELALIKDLKRPPNPAKPDQAVGAKAAVEGIYSLLMWWGHRASLTRGGKWETYAKMFAGGAYVFEHMRAFQKNPTFFIDKVKSRNAVLLQVREPVVRKPGGRSPRSPTDR